MTRPRFDLGDRTIVRSRGFVRAKVITAIADQHQRAAFETAGIGAPRDRDALNFPFIESC